MPVKMDKREYRKIDAAVMETRTAEDGRMIVEGYATTFNQPYRLAADDKIVINEQVDRNAFAETDMSDVIMQYDHEGRVFARIANGTLRLEPDEHGLKITADLGGTEIGRQLFEEIQGGYTNKMSFGFTVAGDRRERSKDAEGRVTVLRTITKIGKLFDVSAVSLPANDATEISSRTVSDGLIAEALEEVRAEEERQRKIGEIRKILKGEQNHDE
ncbi:MAG: HK97 family phage prohead protease [Oscillospiraceae bacterium]|nr:HK97 family phage prohead protease [Oscillospiraceae bacterium]